MPIDWNALNNDIDNAANNASDATDEALATKISSLTSMTDDEVKALFPETGDVKKLAELMAIVKSSQDRNDKINNIVTNSEKFGGIILTLLNKFV